MCIIPDKKPNLKLVITLINEVIAQKQIFLYIEALFNGLDSIFLFDA